MKMFTLSFGILAFLVAGGIFLYGNRASVTQHLLVEQQRAPEPRVFIDGIPIRVTVADTPEAREKGLSGRRELAEGEGMLFVFEEEGRPAFWMKDMRFAIDIVWISARGDVVGIEKAVSPGSYPRTFQPREPVRYVLELPEGFTDANNIRIGSRAAFEML